MSIYRIPYKIEGTAVVVADNEAEAERNFWLYHNSELGALGEVDWVGAPVRDIEAETKDRKLRDELFKEASLG